MGRQVNFFAYGNDHAALVELFTQDGMRAFRRHPRVGQALGPESIPDHDQLGGGTGRAYYLLPADQPVAAVKHLHMTDPTLLRVDETVSPVIEYVWSAHRGRDVEPGRLYVTSDVYAMYESVRQALGRYTRWIKKWPFRSEPGGLPVGPATAKAVKEGTIRLAQIGRPFEVVPK